MTVHVSSSGSHRDEDYPLGREALQALWRMEEGHFWHAARERWIFKALERYGARPGGRFLEVGCGAGAVAGALHRRGYRVTGVDTSETLIGKAHERYPEVDFVLGEVERLPSSLRGPYDAIGFFDVLEHLDSPERLLRQSLRWAAEDALVVATVPAVPELYSTIDRLSGHKRRYRLGELARLFESVGLREVAEHGIFRSTLALQRRFRRRWERDAETEIEIDRAEATAIMADNLRVPPPPVNVAMGLLCALERKLAFRSSRGKTGASLLAVGRRG